MPARFVSGNKWENYCHKIRGPCPESKTKMGHCCCLLEKSTCHKMCLQSSQTKESNLNGSKFQIAGQPNWKDKFTVLLARLPCVPSQTRDSWRSNLGNSIAAVDVVNHVVEIRSPLNMKRLEGHLRQKRYIRMPEIYNVKILENVLHLQLLNGCS